MDLRKQLAVEKRGMSYIKVSDLLEGATTEEDIESRLNSLVYLSRKRQTPLVVEKGALTESADPSEKRLKGLASIISKV